MKLTADLIADSPQFFNPNKDWELDLRGRITASGEDSARSRDHAFLLLGNKIPVLENLGCTLVRLYYLCVRLIRLERPFVFRINSMLLISLITIYGN